MIVSLSSPSSSPLHPLRAAMIVSLSSPSPSISSSSITSVSCHIRAAAVLRAINLSLGYLVFHSFRLASLFSPISGFLAFWLLWFLAFWLSARQPESFRLRHSYITTPMDRHRTRLGPRRVAATHRSVSSLSFSPSQYLCYLYRYDILSATLGLKMSLSVGSLSIGSLSVGYWLWDEPTDDPPPCPHPALVPIPHRLFAPEYISPFKVPCPWYLSIFAPKTGPLSAYPPIRDGWAIPWSLAPKF